MSKLTKLGLALTVVVVVIVVIFAVILADVSTVSHTTQIVNKVATVDPHTYNYYQFTVPKGASGISVSGTFTAQGGSDNDIKVYIFDKTDFSHYQNGEDYTSLYQSGQTTTSSFITKLPSSGTYYLVLDNQFSADSQKTVNIQANVSYKTS
jgi:hypothetical protein